MENTKIIFIDIDGPLCSSRASFLPENKTSLRNKEDPMQQGHHKYFDPCAVWMMNDIILKVKPMFVLSTSWAKYYSIDEMINFFELNKLHINKNNIHEDWVTPKRMSSQRVHEIDWWLDDHPEITEYVIIDDSVSREDFCNVKVDRVVNVDSYDGLNYSNYLEVLKILSYDLENSESRYSLIDKRVKRQWINY